MVQNALEQTAKDLKTFIETKLLISDKNPKGWPLERIFVLGFAQGGTTALHTMDWGSFGGIISISGQPLKHIVLSTPTLLTYGRKDELPSSHLIQAPYFESKAINRQLSMPQSEGEMRIIMKFFAERLFLRHLGLEKMADIYQVK